MLAVGIWGICFTYKNVARENITTPADASIPNARVRGPLTLKSQADVIRKHALERADGATYADTPRQIAQTDVDGNPVLDESGNPIMIPNPTRETWVTATILTTALNLGLITYAFSGLIILLGCISIWTGLVFRKLSRSFT